MVLDLVVLCLTLHAGGNYNYFDAANKTNLLAVVLSLISVLVLVPRVISKLCASIDKLDKVVGHTIVPWVVFLFA